MNGADRSASISHETLPQPSQFKPSGSFVFSMRDASGRFLFERDNFFAIDSGKQCAEAAGCLSRSVNVVRGCDCDVSVTQEILPQRPNRVCGLPSSRFSFRSS